MRMRESSTYYLLESILDSDIASYTLFLLQKNEKRILEMV